MNGSSQLQFTFDEANFELVRNRLIDEIHRRAYHEVGVEVHPLWNVEAAAPTYVVWTPHCLQGSVILGDLDWDSPWFDGLRNRSFHSWHQFRCEAFESAGVTSWRSRRHLGCFHRRGKARYDLVFRIAVAVAALAEGGPSSAHLHMITANAGQVVFDRLVRKLDGSLDHGKPGRHLGVSCCGDPLVLFRTDGPVVTPAEKLDVAELWWNGHGIGDIAELLWRGAGHRHRVDRVTP
ncbi:hypothetical protein ACWDXV_32555 [Nocardia nova]